MQWSKIKNIVILILLAVNLLLLAQVGYREAESARYRREAREEAVALLTNNGIQVDLAILPEDPKLGPMRCERDSGSEAALAAALLGSAAEQEDGSYAGEKGKLWLYSSGDFTAALGPGAYPLGERTAESLSALVMEKLGFEGEVLSTVEADGVTTVRMRQSWEGTPIFSCEAALVFEGGELKSIRGKRLPGTPVSVAGESAMTVTTALVRFLSGVTENGYVRSEVRGLTMGYEMEAVPTSSTFKLTPVWQIETDANPFRLEGDGTLVQVTD